FEASTSYRHLHTWTGRRVFGRNDERPRRAARRDVLNRNEARKRSPRRLKGPSAIAHRVGSACVSRSRRIRQNAVIRAIGDPDRDRPDIGPSRTISPQARPYYRQLLETAGEYLKREEYDLAVILAQTACEVVTEQAFDVFFELRGTTKADRKALFTA